MGIYDADEFLNYLSGANRGAYNLKDLGELGINTDLFNFNLDLPELNLGNMVGQLDDLINFDPELLSGFAKLFPEDYKVLQSILSSNTGNLEQDYVVTDKGTVVDTKGEPLFKITNTGNTGNNTATNAKTDPLDRFEEDTSVFDKSKRDPLNRFEEDTSVFDKSKTDPLDRFEEDTSVFDNSKTDLLKGISKAIKDAIGISGTDLTKGLLAAYLAKKAYDEGQEARNYRRGATMGVNAPVTATRNAFQGTKYSAAGGGIGSLDMTQGRYLGGTTDGMADKIPAHIDRKRPAALSDGEFVIPADVVSHLGNGNSSAGAKRLYEMMDRIRHARTGNPRQGKQINPNKFLPR